MSNRIHLPKNLFYLRKLRGLKQDQMEFHTGCSRTTWSNYENGISEPSVSMLVNISNFFGITLEDLVLKDLSIEQASLFKRKRTKASIYEQQEADELAMVEEGHLQYLIGEVKKLREEMDLMKRTE